MVEPLSSVIRPESGPSLPALARLARPAPQNLIAAELESRSSPGDIVVDLFGRGGWVSRAAVNRLRRAYVFESSALTRLLAELVMRPPDIRHFDAAVNAMAVQPRGEVGLRQAIQDMYATRCPTCGRSVVADEFIWDGDAPAPSRKVYRCLVCRDQQGGAEQRSAPTDEEDTERLSRLESADSAREALRSRFPVLDGHEELPDQLLGLYTPRNLVSMEAILARLEQDLRAAPIEAALRLGLLHVVLPASRLNSYPGRVAGLRIVNASVRGPGERQWREANLWRLFEDGCRMVLSFIQRLEGSGTDGMN